MELEESQLRRVPDGGVLYTLANGIQILRRKKHEPIHLEGLTEAEQRRRTSKREGSKFLPGTTLRDIVKMTCDILIENGAEPGANTGYNKVYEHPIGISRGRAVTAVRVVRSNNGKIAHAYPEDERRL